MDLSATKSPVYPSELMKQCDYWGVDPRRVQALADVLQQLFAPYVKEHAPTVPVDADGRRVVWDYYDSGVEWGDIMRVVEVVEDMDISHEEYRAVKDAHRNTIYDLPINRTDGVLFFVGN